MKRFMLLILTVVFAFTLTSCGGKSGPVNITASKVKSDRLLSNFPYKARLKSADEVTVGPKFSAMITSVRFKVGDRVKQGDVLFVLDSSDLENKLKQANAAYNIAVSNYNSVTNGSAAQTKQKLQQAVTAAQIELDNATAFYNITKEKYDNKTDIVQAQLAYDTAKSNYEKCEYLVSTGEESAFSLKQAKIAMDNAQAALQSATIATQLAFDNAEYKLNSAKTALAAAQQNLQLNVSTLIPESVEAAQKQVESAKTAVDIAKSALNDTEICAPISGVISAIHATAGELAVPGTSNVTIISQSPIDLVICVTENDVTELRTGMSVAVTPDSVHKVYTGIVRTIAPSANAQTALFDVTIKIDNSPGELKPGMMATAKFNAGGENPALYVPQQSIVNENGSTYVYKVKGISVKKTAVTLGTKEHLYIEVKSGLIADDIVVVDGADKVNEGNTVNILKSVD